MAATEPSQLRDALVERLFGATLGAMDVLSVYLGARLGLYRALADRGTSSSEELAESTELNERYVREWLEQQATTGILDLEDDGRFTLPAGHDEALLDEKSLNYVAPFGKLLVACVRPIDQLLEAFRSGDGVPYADYGDDLHEGQAEFTRPIFDSLLGSEWFPGIPDVHERLLADPPARVAHGGRGRRLDARSKIGAQSGAVTTKPGAALRRRGRLEACATPEGGDPAQCRGRHPARVNFRSSV